MGKFISVDTGKGDTKVTCYNEEQAITNEFLFHTKWSEGNFADDDFGKGTFITEVDGKVYKIGNNAINGAELTTSKKTEIHKACILTGVAMCCEDEETVEDVTVVIGMPVLEYQDVEKRLEYKNYMLPEGLVSVKLKTKSEGAIVNKTFNIVGRYVYPESAGALYINPTKYSEKSVGVIDLGNLNINITQWNNFELDAEYSLTDELGGSILLSGLSQELSAKFGRIDEKYTLKVLSQDKENRKLVPNTPNKEVEKESALFINKYLLQFVKDIKRKCDAKHWSLDFMDLVFIGGTTKLLKNEIYEVFGNSVEIPKNPEFVNSFGFLRRLCAYKLGIMIPEAEHTKNKKENAA